MQRKPMPLPGNWTLPDILTLSYIKGINSSRLNKTVEYVKSLDDLLHSHTKNEYSVFFKQDALFGDSLQNSIDTARKEAEEQIILAEKNNSKIITLWDDEYPSLLKEIDIPPVILYVKGKLQHADSVSISIVGTRRCSRYGIFCAESFAEYFAIHRIIITSGLAEGIDTYSHLAAIKANGTTYAVIASGLDCIKPSISQDNANKIIETGGAIISEHRFGTLALPGYFPQRNRIISGISKATLVIESGEKGGALITARFAFDQQREVYAVPGNIDSEKSKGTNNLIKKNIAIPALTPEDVFHELGFYDQNEHLLAAEAPKLALENDEIQILEAIESEPLNIDDLAIKTGFDISALLVTLLNMEFKGLVKQLPGKYYLKANFF